MLSLAASVGVQTTSQQEEALLSLREDHTLMKAHLSNSASSRHWRKLLQAGQTGAKSSCVIVWKSKADGTERSRCTLDTKTGAHA